MISYWGATFFDFISLFFTRLFTFFHGGLEVDELQVIALVLISCICSLLGVFLYVRKMAMVANAISHTVLVGIVLAAIVSHFVYAIPIGVMEGSFTPAILIGSGVITSLLTMALIEFLSRTSRMSQDVSIGLVFTFLFAVGVVMATIFTRNAHIGSEVIMGNIDLICLEDLKGIGYLFTFVLSIVVIFYRPILISSFDGQFASLSGISKRGVNYLIVLLTSLVIIIAMKAVGIILILSLLIVPPLTARLFFRSMKSVIFASMGIGATASFASVAFSRHLLTTSGVALSTGGLVVAILALFWGVAALLAPSKGILSRWLLRQKIDFSAQE